MKKARNGFMKNICYLCLIGVIALGLMTIIGTSGGGGDNGAGGSEDNTYTVGGTVNGLSGTLVLQNNASDDLTITQDGSFTFSTALNNGSSYEATVKTDPSGQNCTVNNGSGTINGVNITNIVVSCVGSAQILKSEYRSGTWTHPADLSDNISPDGEDAKYPRVEMDNNGNAVIVWSQLDGSMGCQISTSEGPVTVDCSQIFKSEYRSGIWSHPADLSDNISPDRESVYNPRVSMDNNENTIIVWRTSQGLFKSEYRSGTWSHPVDLSDSIVQGLLLYHPLITMDNNGNAIIVWYQNAADIDWSIFKSEYRTGTWTHPVDIYDNISPDERPAYSPHVAMDNNQNAIIVWYTPWKIFKSEYRTGTWTHPADLSDNINPDGQHIVYFPWVAMDNNGNAIIVWQQSDDGNQQIFKSEYRNSTWTHPTDLSDNISPDGQDAESPQVAMDNNGNAIIVWKQSDGGNQQIFKSEYRTGTWTHPTDLSDNISPDGQDAESPQVAMDNNGNAIIVWQQSDGGDQQIFKSEYRNGSWSHPANLSDNISPDGQDAESPQVAMDNNGNAIIVWSQYDDIN